MDAAGEGFRQLTDGHHEVRYPAWNPNGNEIIICLQPYGEL